MYYYYLLIWSQILTEFIKWIFEFIEKILQEPSKPNHNDFEKVIHAKRYRESHGKKIKNHHRRKKEAKEVEEEEEPTAEITYESEFESEESENESDSNVLTEISAATETNE